MQEPVVALMSPGDMGHAIGAQLRHHGLRVLTVLGGRSQRTAQLAAQAGIEDAGDDDALVRQADVLLSVLPPARARELAERVAAALRRTGASLLYADLNAIAPQTARQIGAVVEVAGARFVDGGIIGGPPRITAGGAGQGQPGGPRIYASGPHAAQLAALRPYGLDVRVMGATEDSGAAPQSEVGQASCLKMCYGALTKGLTALGTELLTAAASLGLDGALRQELEQSQGALFAWLARAVPSMPPKAYRWVGEMEEVAATFEAAGLPPQTMAGAAALYRLVEGTPLGRETPEDRQQGQTLEDVVAALVAALPSAGSSESSPSSQPRA